MRIVSYSLLLIIVILGVTFAIQNSEKVLLHYYVGQSQMPLSLVLVLSFASGCLIGTVVMGWLLVKVKIQNRQLRKQLKLAEKEVENLRAIPLQDKH